MKNILIIIAIFFGIFTYHLANEYDSNSILNIAGIFGKSASYFIIIIPVVFLTQFISHKFSNTNDVADKKTSEPTPKTISDKLEQPFTTAEKHHNPANNFNTNPNLIDYSTSANNIDSHEYLKEFVKDMESWDDDFIDSLDEKSRDETEQLMETYTLDGWYWLETEEGQKIVDTYAKRLYEILAVQLGHAIHNTDLKEFSYSVFDPKNLVNDLDRSLKKNMTSATPNQIINALTAARDLHIELIETAKRKALEDPFKDEILEDPLIQLYTLDGWEWLQTDEGKKKNYSYIEQFHTILNGQLGGILNEIDLEIISINMSDPSMYSYCLNSALEESLLKPTAKQIETVSKSWQKLHTELVEYTKVKGKESKSLTHNTYSTF